MNQIIFYLWRLNSQHARARRLFSKVLWRCINMFITQFNLLSGVDFMVGLPSATFLKNALGETSHWIKVQSSTSQIKGEGIQIRNDYISSVLWYDMAAFVSGSGEKAENASRDSGREATCWQFMGSCYLSNCHSLNFELRIYVLQKSWLRWWEWPRTSKDDFEVVGTFSFRFQLPSPNLNCLLVWEGKYLIWNSVINSMRLNKLRWV